MTKKRGLIFLILIFGFILSLFLSLFYGLDNFSDILKGFLDGSIKNSNTEIILSLIRIPSVIKAIVAGSCLALSGMFLQTVSKNPLADPYLTGLSSGAGLGIVISILLFNSINYSLFGNHLLIECNNFLILSYHLF